MGSHGPGGGRFSTVVMVPHTHGKSFQGGGAFVAPDGQVLPPALAPVNEGDWVVWTGGNPSFPSYLKMFGGVASGSIMMEVGTGGGFKLQIFNGGGVLPSVRCVSTDGFGADLIGAVTPNATVFMQFTGTGGLRFGAAPAVGVANGINLGYDANNYFRFDPTLAGFLIVNANVNAFSVDNGVHVRNDVGFEYWAGNKVNTRLRIQATALIHRIQGDGTGVDSNFEAYDLVTTTGVNPAPGNTIIWDPAVPGRVTVGAAGALQPIGVCLIGGGVGDAPGTIKCTVILKGYKAVLVSDAAITQFRRIKPGAGLAHRWADAGAAAVAALQHSIGFALEAVAASGTNFKAWITGPILYV